jgi:uncharacterized protein YndB with AHSA1/START domain
MTATSTDRIDKQIHLNATLDRVWQALTDYREFSQWFGVALACPFVQGQEMTGTFTKTCCEEKKTLPFKVFVKTIQPKNYFAFEWHPYAVDLEVDYESETPTLVEFTLESKEGGTLLKVSESGFDALPAHRRDEAFRMNSGGWEHQMGNIQSYVIKNT